jgi:ERCC4-type nuclease
MITLDDRAGSRDLYSPLLSLGVKVQLGRLPFGDLSFVGNGPDGIPQQIGIEHKRVSDVLQCITDGRFTGHQLPGLVGQYNRVWLWLEGEYRAGRSGLLQRKLDSGRGEGRWVDCSMGRRSFHYHELESWLNTLEIKAGVHVRRTANQMESVTSIAALYRWWTGKDWEDHKSHLGFDLSGECDRALLLPPHFVRRVAKELSGVGWERSAAIVKHFGTDRGIVPLITAELEDWCRIDGIGKGTAVKIMRELGSDRL